MLFQSFFISTMVQPAVRAFIKPLASLPDVRIAVVGRLAFGVGVMDEHSEAGAFPGSGPLEHLEVTIGVARGEDRAAADVLLNADGFAVLVVDEVESPRF